MSNCPYVDAGIIEATTDAELLSAFECYPRLLPKQCLSSPDPGWLADGSYAAAACLYTAGFDLSWVAKDERFLNFVEAQLRQTDTFVLNLVEKGEASVSKGAVSFRAADNKVEVALRLCLPSSCYRDYLCQNSYAKTLGLCFDEHDNSNLLSFEANLSGSVSSSFGIALGAVFDFLANLHFDGVRTLTRNGGQPFSLADCDASRLWLDLLAGLRAGRTGRCQVCGRPYLSCGERGKKRRFCSDACKTYSHRYPGKTRKAGQRIQGPAVI